MRGTKGREDLFRLRIGDYRVIYAVVAGIVYITDIFHRGKGYKQLP
ncbi:MAG: type II toxin-antitoxin system RelE/ParE family toxin [Candidatus Bathyarchaeia archaeon]